MSRKVLTAFALAAAISLMPFAVDAHEGHQHPTKAKKVKKPKEKKAAILFEPSPLRARSGLRHGVRQRIYAIVSIELTTC